MPQVKPPDLPEYMTWEELERLPEEIAEQIELWKGRVVWARRGPGEHQVFSVRLFNALERWARKSMSDEPEQCWRVNTETNVFFGSEGKSDFLTPDFLVHRCLSGPYQDIRTADVLLAGEVLSPSNKPADIVAKKARYAEAGIPWYWEVEPDREISAIAVIRAYGLETGYGRLPDGVRPLHPVNYLLVGEWTQDDSEGVVIDYPFPIRIPWSDLEF